jgi:hypothetical protein
MSIRFYLKTGCTITCRSRNTRPTSTSSVDTSSLCACTFSDGLRDSDSFHYGDIEPRRMDSSSIHVSSRCFFLANDKGVSSALLFLVIHKRVSFTKRKYRSLNLGITVGVGNKI